MRAVTEPWSATTPVCGAWQQSGPGCAAVLVYGGTEMINAGNHPHPPTTPVCSLRFGRPATCGGAGQLRHGPAARAQPLTVPVARGPTTAGLQRLQTLLVIARGQRSAGTRSPQEGPRHHQPRLEAHVGSPSPILLAVGRHRAGGAPCRCCLLQQLSPSGSVWMCFQSADRLQGS